MLLATETGLTGTTTLSRDDEEELSDIVLATSGPPLCPSLLEEWAGLTEAPRTLATSGGDGVPLSSGMSAIGVWSLPSGYE